MIVRVQLFAVARELAGGRELAVEVPEGATIADIRAAMQVAAPRLVEVLGHCRFALDNEFANNDSTVSGNSELAVIPPVSGG
jgi:molybdopterin converting factor subunit 1